MTRGVQRARRTWLRLGLPLAGGALVGLSLPPLGSWPLGVVGVAAVVWALRGRSWRGRIAVGFLAGIGQFAIALAWALQFNTAGYIVLVLAESLILAVGLMLAPSSGPLRVPAVAAALTLAEWVRNSWPFGGLPLGSSALGQVGGPLGAAARLGGPLLVVFTLGLVGGGLADLVGAIIGGEGKDPKRDRLAGSILSLVAAGGLVGAGVSALPSQTGPRHPISVAIVQGGGERGLTALQVPASRVFNAALRETRKVTGHPSIILWPEDVVAMGSTPFVGSHAEATLASVARRHRATLFAGVTEDVGATQFRNEIVAISPTGELEATFEKVHRVPFGEYVPYRGFFSHFANLEAVPRDAIAGVGSGLMRTTAAPVAVLVSFEVFFAERGRSGVRAGGQLILVPTNTSSYSNGQAPAQEIAASRLQAIEQDRYLLQAAPTGYSAVVTPSGAVTYRTKLSDPAVIETTVLRITNATPYDDVGDLPVIVGSALLLALAWLTVGRRRKATDGEDIEAPSPA